MKLILLRHGQSLYNLEQRFCGWIDVPLTEKGIEEAKNAGQKLKKENISFSIAYVSVLKRAVDTLEYVKKEMKAEIPTIQNWHLNERHYGALQGLKHEEMEKKYGQEQVHIWRRSYSVRPPMISQDDPRNPAKDPKYKDLNLKDIPLGESLEDTLNRTVPYYNKEIKPHLQNGENVLIVASGNSIRSLIKHLENISNEEIINLNFPTGVPYVYDMDQNLNIKNKYYL